MIENEYETLHIKTPVFLLVVKLIVLSYILGVNIPKFSYEGIFALY